MECHFKGGSVNQKTNRSIVPVCKKYSFKTKCVGESNCRYVKEQEEIIRKQTKAS